MFSITKRRVGGPATRLGSANATTVRSADCSFTPSGPFGGNSNKYQRVSPVRARLEQGSVAHEWIPQDIRTQNKLMRNIYMTDGVVGSAIDFYKEIPFGPLILGTIKDSKILQFYNDALDAINIQRFLPFLAGDLLTVGRLITHKIMDESKGMWVDLVVHDSDWVKVEPQPIVGEDPIIDLIIPPEYRRWALSKDPRIRKSRSKVDPRLIKLMAAGGTIPLSPDNTDFIARKMTSGDDLGTGLPFRVLPLIALEYSYLDADVTGLRRRAAPILYATMGIENSWDPSPDEMMAVQDMLIASEEDPVGAKIVLRNGIELNTVSGHGDIAKYGEQWPWLREAKLQGVGMNEAFATGESSWCLPGNSLISTSKGLLPIKDIPNFVGLSTREAKRIGTISLEGSGLELTTGEGEHTASAWAYSGKKLVKRVTTSSGYTLDGTNEHPVLVLTPDLDLKWVQIKDVKKGDVVALRHGGSWPTESPDLSAARLHAYEAPHIKFRRNHTRNLLEPTLPSVLTKELSAVLGYLVSEGDCTDRDRVIFGNVDYDVLEHYNKCHKTVFPDQHLSETIVPGTNYPFVSLTTCSWVVREFLSQLGLDFVLSSKKEIPWVILRSTKVLASAFLSALFEGDGSPSHGIEYSSTSLKLVRQVQQLLLKFNILAKREKLTGGKWRIRIFGRENIQSFINEIDFVSSTKRKAVREYLDVRERCERQRWKYLGTRIQQCVSNVLDERKKGTRYYNSQGDVVCATVRGWRINRVNPDADHAPYLLKELEKVDVTLSEKIKYLWSLPYVWVEVERIGKLGIKPVYDLCVPEHESYVANGFVVHNSYLESMLSLGMERIRNFRDFITLELIIHGILEPLARLHGFVKRSQASYNGRIRTSSKIDDSQLILPSVEWKRSLKPNSDRDYLDILTMMEEKGVPILLRQWAQAGGVDIDESIDGAAADIDLRKKVKTEWTDKKKELGGDEEEKEEKRWGSAYVVDAVANLPVWQNGEFGSLRRAQVTELIPKLENRWSHLTVRQWKTLENRLRTRHNFSENRVRQFQYLLSRAGIIKDPLPPKVVIEARDSLMARVNGRAPDRKLLHEIYWLNHQIELRANTEHSTVERVVDRYNLSQNHDWIRPAGPNLLTGVQ